MDYKKIGELIITGVIIIVAFYMLYKNIKNRNNRCSGCGSCSKMCPYYAYKKRVREDKREHR